MAAAAATSNAVCVGKEPLTLSQVCLVATRTAKRNCSAVELDEAALAGVEASAASAAAARLPGVPVPPPVPAGSTGKCVKLEFVRAGILCRLVRAMQGRSGVRRSTVEALAALLNDEEGRCEPALGAIPADADISEAIVGLLAPLLPPADGGGGDKACMLTAAEAGVLLGVGGAQASLTGGAALVLGGGAVGAGTVNAIAALTMTAACSGGGPGGGGSSSTGGGVVGVPSELVATDGGGEARFEHRPHRSIITAASELRVLLFGAPVATVNSASSPSEVAHAKLYLRTPEVHGPAVDALATAAKAVAVEFNASERSPVFFAAGAPTGAAGTSSGGGGSDDADGTAAVAMMPNGASSATAFSTAPVASALRIATGALAVLASQSLARSCSLRRGTKPFDPSAYVAAAAATAAAAAQASASSGSKGGAWASLGRDVEGAAAELAALQEAVLGETEAALAAIDNNNHAFAGGAVSQASAGGASGASGFDGTSSALGASSSLSAEVQARLAAEKAKEEEKMKTMNPAQLEKYLKKKAAKDQKAAKKKADKEKNKDGGGAAGGAGAGGGGGDGAWKLSPGAAKVLSILAEGIAAKEEEEGGAQAAAGGTAAGGLDWRKDAEALAARLNFYDPSGGAASGNDNTVAAAVGALLEKGEAELVGGARRKPKIAKGTRDFLPAQMKVRAKAFGIIRGVFDRHGAVEIDTPVFELKQTLTGKYGEDSKLIYDLADQGGELLALRYDLTVPFARYLAMHSVGNIKRYHIAKVYRRDRPVVERGRFREFYQCDFDVAGTYLPMVSDAEVVTVACEILSALNIGSFVVKLNHRVLLDAIFEICGVPAEKFRTICSAVDKLDKAPWEEVKREMIEEKGLEEEKADKIGKFVCRGSMGAGKRMDPKQMHATLMEEGVFGTHKGALEAMEQLAKLWDYLDAMGSLKYVSFDLSLARGLDYYTGVIYECVHTQAGGPGVGSIAAGGRYDNLVKMFSGDNAPQTPCVGVSMGVERIFRIMEENLAGRGEDPPVQCFVSSVGKGMLVHRMALAKELWGSGVSAEFFQNKENPKFAGPNSQLEYTLKKRIPVIAIIGESEVAAGVVKVKAVTFDEDESGGGGGGGGGNNDGVVVPRPDFPEYVKSLLGLDSSSGRQDTGMAVRTGAPDPAGTIQVKGISLKGTQKYSVLDVAPSAE